MKNFIQTAVLCALVFSLNSCYITRTTVGDGPVGKDIAATHYSHAKQMYVLWGLLPLKHTQPSAPQGCGYQVKSSFNFVDALVTGLTGGIFGMRTVKIMVNKGGPCDPAILKIERKEEKAIEKIEQKDRKKDGK